MLEHWQDTWSLTNSAVRSFPPLEQAESSQLFGHWACPGRSPSVGIGSDPLKRRYRYLALLLYRYACATYYYRIANFACQAPLIQAAIATAIEYSSILLGQLASVVLNRTTNQIPAFLHRLNPRFHPDVWHRHDDHHCHIPLTGALRPRSSSSSPLNTLQHPQGSLSTSASIPLPPSHL